MTLYIFNYTDGKLSESVLENVTVGASGWYCSESDDWYRIDSENKVYEDNYISNSVIAVEIFTTDINNIEDIKTKLLLSVKRRIKNLQSKLTKWNAELDI